MIGIVDLNTFSPQKTALLWLAGLLLLAITMPAQSVSVVRIDSSSQSAPFRQVIESFKQALTESLPDVQFVGDDQPNESIAAADLVFALGSRALAKAITADAQQNILATMILDDNVLHQAGNATAVLLKTTARQQLQWHRKVLPDHHRIGVLYDPAINQKWVDEARRQAARLGLMLIAIGVDSAKKLPAALKQIGRDADSLLAVTDKTVYSAKTAKSVLLFSFRNRIPFIGLSEAWVKAGALYALDWDYPALGRQSAELALKILQGQLAGDIRIQHAHEKIYRVNPKTVKRMKLTLPASLMKAQHFNEQDAHE